MEEVFQENNNFETMEEETEEEVLTVGNIHNLCIVCSSTIPIQVLSIEDEEKEDDNRFRYQLVKFEKELGEIVSNSNSSTRSTSSSTRAYRGSSLKNKGSTSYPRGRGDKKMYNVCSNCKILMTSAFSSKSQLEEMEKHVRYLQGAILRALQIVDRHLKKFNRDLSKIGNVIKMSTEDGKCTSTNNSSEAGVLGFRECILNAATNLDQFRKKKESKNVDLISSRKSTHQISPEVLLEEPGDDINITASQMATDNIVDDNHDDNWLPDHDDNADDGINDNVDSVHNDQLTSRYKRTPKVSSSAPSQLINDLDLLKECPRVHLGKRFSAALEPVTSSMSPFKAAIVRRTFNKTKRKPRQTEPEGPLAYHYVTYNADTDELSVDNQIPIRFNEIDQCLECSQCNYTCKGPDTSESNRNTSEKKMMYHILGKHMNIFKCEECDKPMTSYCQYVKHREIHKKMGCGNEPVCDICGRVLKSVESFEDHKWVHMTAEEKEEARRQGRKDPSDKFKKLPRRYQCQQCGKGFRRPCELKKHMRGVHGENWGEEEGEGEVETFMCGGCGVIFKEMGNLTKHLKLQRCKGMRRDEGVKEEVN